MSWLSKQWHDLLDHGSPALSQGRANKRAEAADRAAALLRAQPNVYGLANASPAAAGPMGTSGTAGTVAGPQGQYQPTPGLVMEPGVNPFLGAAKRAGMSLTPTQPQQQAMTQPTQQQAMATALRGGA